MTQKQYPTIFHLFSDVFAKSDAACVLIGGFAVNYYVGDGLKPSPTI